MNLPNIDLDTVKGVADFVVGVSTTFVVGGVIKNNVSAETASQQARLVVGTLAIGAVVSKKTRAHVNDSLDSLHEKYELFREQRNTKKSTKNS